MSDNQADAKSRPRGREADDKQAFDRMMAELERMNVGELRELASAAESLIQRKAEDEKRSLKEEIERRAADLGISIRDLFGEPVQASGRGRGRPARKAETEAPAPKYRGPNGEGWSGRGRMPKWLQVAQAEGKSKDDYLIRS
ncbi:H-NS histone family protein [Sabulicella glaciei]|uniref:H-NS histone family protein n=1 Tax=Sabulicella glaciei TaxID=2984948 RepID=A0ABT3NTU4_9PROT|nr:H-NS histone family protein [Roseococcus sp. MDT2-1-1]MCW8085590.1 H-NS histone family protein [Roseococcus sp. MDT2-1-1]